jgi:FMN phosphatase YigB (HAD superfamily)
MKYSETDSRKKGFILELDDVLYPEKDYLFQVYYLFAGLLEYTELIDAQAVTQFMVNTYNTAGKAHVFDKLKEKFSVEEKYRRNFEELLLTASLPLKLLLYKNMLNLLQELVVDRKKVFIVTNGNPQQQLNKIRQMEWNGLESYLVVYFADETKPKPAPDAILALMQDHAITDNELLMIGSSAEDRFCAGLCGIDFAEAKDFLN